MWPWIEPFLPIFLLGILLVVFLSFLFFPPLFSLSFNRHLLLDSVYGMVMRKRKNCLDLMFVSQATIEKEYMGGRNCFVSMDILVEISVWGEDFNVIRLVTCEIKGR